MPPEAQFQFQQFKFIFIDFLAKKSLLQLLPLNYKSAESNGWVWYCPINYLSIRKMEGGIW